MKAISNLKFQIPDFIAAGLVAAAAVPALLFGAVEYWAMAASGALAIIVFMAGVFTYSGGIGGKKKLICTALALVLYLVFQMVPLPASVLGLLEPRMAAMMGPVAFHSVTVYQFKTEEALARLAVYLMVFFTSALFIDGRSVNKVLKGLSIFGFALALFAIVQHVTWNGKIYWFASFTPGGNPFGPFVDRDHFPGYINMIIPLSLAVAVASKSIEKKVLYTFFAAVMALSVFLSLSRGGVISFICGLAVFSAILLIRRSPKWQLMLLAVFAVAFASFVLYAGVAPLLARFSKEGVSDTARLMAWKGAWAAFRDFPVFGTGLGTFVNVFTYYQPIHLQKIWEHAHNDYLELLTEGGLAGFLISAAFVVAILRAAFGEKSNWEGRAAYFKAGFIASLVTISVHSFVDFNLHVPSNAILLSIIIGLAVAKGD